ncbi:hypothetical protein L207DRAFT_525317 [Hyaloscypha variabilis F]|uniref:C2H2-type domain-containing protein n=1 Tax=Hyaloscypha variabilis (strain UAMH 11265 / GT02V1 / F) TaxID=1149755 RepID=A0A2J6RZL3_HYAVF|nr:hypothetical protein L207DRAFT_525317 [Hyaloscypha variabilis F]
MPTTKNASSHPLPADLLQYLSLYRVVICSSCKYAIQPQAIARHLKEIHHINRGHRRPYMQYISTLSLARVEDILDCKVKEFPVPLLPVQDGLACESEDCGYLCISAKRMRTHWLDQHGRSGQAFLDWQPVKLQTFFRGNLLRYFTDLKSSCSEVRKVPHCDLRSNPEFGRTKAGIEAHDLTLSYIIDPASHPSLDEQDAQLFCHYINNTSCSISTTTTASIWQVHVPKLAAAHPFLLHGILALSALHLAHLTPTSRTPFIITANTHQSIAMPLFRTAITSVTLQNSEAVLVFSHLLILYSFASEPQDEHLFLTTSTSTPPSPPSTPAESDETLLPPWLYFLRNGCALLCTVWDYLEASPVAPLASMWDIPLLTPSSPTPLLTHVLSLIPSATSSSPWSPEETTLYTQAAHDLAAAFHSTSPSHSPNQEFTPWTALRIWPMQLSLPFLAMIKEGHPGALVLLAHYCILLKKIEGAWYFEGRSRRLMGVVMGRLGREWWGFVEGVMGEVEG